MCVYIVGVCVRGRDSECVGLCERGEIEKEKERKIKTNVHVYVRGAVSPVPLRALLSAISSDIREKLFCGIPESSLALPLFPAGPPSVVFFVISAEEAKLLVYFLLI